MSVITYAEAREEAAELVAALAPLTEAEAWGRAQTDPYGLLSPEQLHALERLDALDWLFAGISRGCHFGACRTDPHGNVLPVDTSWRSSVI